MEKFIGNFRKRSHARGTVEYSFLNFSLRTGKLLTIREIFPDPAYSAPRFWKYADGKLREKGSPCPSSGLILPSKRPGGGEIRPEDLLLSRLGATTALWTKDPSKCQSMALDIPMEDMLALGADPGLWAGEN